MHLLKMLLHIMPIEAKGYRVPELFKEIAEKLSCYKQILPHGCKKMSQL